VQQIDEARSGLEKRVSEAKLRCEEIERALQGLMHQQMECDAIKSRVAPLLDSETGVRPRLRTLQDTHAELIAGLEGVEHDNGGPLDRTRAGVHRQQVWLGAARISPARAGDKDRNRSA
jgi:hypothetical protein